MQDCPAYNSLIKKVPITTALFYSYGISDFEVSDHLQERVC